MPFQSANLRLGSVPCIRGSRHSQATLVLLTARAVDEWITSAGIIEVNLSHWSIANWWGEPRCDWQGPLRFECPLESEVALAGYHNQQLRVRALVPTLQLQTPMYNSHVCCTTYINFLCSREQNLSRLRNTRSIRWRPQLVSRIPSRPSSLRPTSSRSNGHRSRNR